VWHMAVVTMQGVLPMCCTKVCVVSRNMACMMLKSPTSLEHCRTKP
jgi:hypothetical protein